MTVLVVSSVQESPIQSALHANSARFFANAAVEIFQRVQACPHRYGHILYAIKGIDCFLLKQSKPYMGVQEVSIALSQKQCNHQKQCQNQMKLLPYSFEDCFVAAGPSA